MEKKRMTKTFSVKVEDELVTVSLSRLTQSSLETELAKLQHKKYLVEKKKHQADLKSQQLQYDIDKLNKQILAFNSDECKRLIKEEEKEKNLKLIKRHIAQLNAEQIMLEFFGQDAHDKFMEERQYIFGAKDGETYKITPEGTVFKQKDHEWEPICLIRPRELPLPDFIVAAITSVKTQPERYQEVRR